MRTLSKGLRRRRSLRMGVCHFVFERGDYSMRWDLLGRKGFRGLRLRVGDGRGVRCGWWWFAMDGIRLGFISHT